MTFDTLALLYHHLVSNPTPSDEEFEEIVVAARAKQREEIDTQEAIEALAQLQAMVGEGESWVKAIHLITTSMQEDRQPELSVR